MNHITLQLGTISLPKSANPDHIRTNAQLDFTIDEADMQQLVGMKLDYEEDARFPMFGKAPK